MDEKTNVLIKGDIVILKGNLNYNILLLLWNRKK